MNHLPGLHEVPPAPRTPSPEARPDLRLQGPPGGAARLRAGLSGPRLDRLGGVLLGPPRGRGHCPGHPGGPGHDPGSGTQPQGQDQRPQAHEGAVRLPGRAPGARTKPIPSTSGPGRGAQSPLNRRRSIQTGPACGAGPTPRSGTQAEQIVVVYDPEDPRINTLYVP